jgi:hypothetical protein
MLAYQLRALNAYPGEVRELLHAVLVDDGSPTPAVAVLADYGVPNLGSFRVFRTLVDVPWNQEFATNLGVSQVETEWLMHLDIDHEMPPETAAELVFGNHRESDVHVFPRVVATRGLPRLWAPGLWFLTKRLYDLAGGMDERFAGAYLPSDRDFCQRLERIMWARVVLPCPLIVHDEDDGIPDASSIRSTPHVVGDAGEALYSKIIAFRAGRPPLRLTYPWERVL